MKKVCLPAQQQYAYYLYAQLVILLKRAGMGEG